MKKIIEVYRAGVPLWVFDLTVVVGLLVLSILYFLNVSVITKLIELL